MTKCKIINLKMKSNLFFFNNFSQTPRKQSKKNSEDIQSSKQEVKDESLEMGEVKGFQHGKISNKPRRKRKNKSKRRSRRSCSRSINNDNDLSR